MRAPFLNDDAGRTIEHLVHSREIAWHSHQKGGVDPSCAFSRVKVGERRPFKNPRFSDQHWEWLVKTACSEFEPPREGFAVLNVTPNIEPRIVRRPEDITDEQFLRSMRGGHPPQISFDDKRGYVRVRICGQPAQIHRLTLLDGFRPTDLGLFRIRQRTRLHESFLRV